MFHHGGDIDKTRYLFDLGLKRNNLLLKLMFQHVTQNDQTPTSSIHHRKKRTLALLNTKSLRAITFNWSFHFPLHYMNQ